MKVNVNGTKKELLQNLWARDSYLIEYAKDHYLLVSRHSIMGWDRLALKVDAAYLYGYNSTRPEYSENSEWAKWPSIDYFKQGKWSIKRHYTYKEISSLIEDELIVPFKLNTNFTRIRKMYDMLYDTLKYYRENGKYPYYEGNLTITLPHEDDMVKLDNFCIEPLQISRKGIEFLKQLENERKERKKQRRKKRSKRGTFEPIIEDDFMTAEDRNIKGLKTAECWY